MGEIFVNQYYIVLQPENEEQPSSPSVKKSEEKGVTVVHEVKCKLYVKVMAKRMYYGLEDPEQDICRIAA